MSACSFGDFAAESSRWIQESDRESIAMETLYDLLGALPNDDADELRAAFRRAVKRVHPDINSEDLDAGLKFRRIVRATVGEALTPATATTEAVREPVAIVAPAEEGAASVSAAPQETSGRADITTSALAPAAGTEQGPGGPPLGHTPKHVPKFASAYTDRSIFLYHLRKFTHTFAELAEAKRPHRASRPIRSSPPQSRTRQHDWEQ